MLMGNITILALSVRPSLKDTLYRTNEVVPHEFAKGLIETSIIKTTVLSPQIENSCTVLSSISTPMHEIAAD